MWVSGVRYTEGHFRSRRGHRHFYCAFFPPAGVPVRGVVLFMHGIGEHAHRFPHVYEWLTARGFGVLAHDMIGHGRSDCDATGLRGHSEGFADMVDDTNDFLTAARYAVYPEMLPTDSDYASPPPPLFFMGISYGTLVGLHVILSGEHPFSGVILASPALGVEMTPLLRLQSLVQGPIVRAFPLARIVPGVNFAGLSRDPAFLPDYLADRLNVTDNMTARMGANTLVAMAALAAHPAVADPTSAFSQLPILIIQGTEDKVTSVPVCRAFYQRLHNYDKELREYDGLFHCIFDEPERHAVLEDVASWLLARVTMREELAASIEQGQAAAAIAAGKGTATATPTSRL